MAIEEWEEKATIGPRLAEERKRLGLSQDALATQLLVTRKTQVKYEAGVTFPDAKYLSMLEQLGADTHYIVTGARLAHRLTVEEQALVAGFRKLDQGGRDGLLRMVVGTDKPQELAAVVVRGDVGQIVEGDAVFHQPVDFTVGGRKRKPKP